MSVGTNTYMTIKVKKKILDGMTRLSSKMEGQSDFNLEEICNKSQWSSGSRQERGHS